MRVVGALAIAGDRFGIPVSIAHSASGDALLLVEALIGAPPSEAMRARVAALVPDARVSFAHGTLRVELPGGEPDAFPLAAILDVLTTTRANAAGPYR